MCFDSCLKGRHGKSFFGCTTKFGIHMVGLISLAEIVLISLILTSELKEGIVNLKVIIWLAMVVWRMLAYLTMCCDGIKQRKAFMWSMTLTTLLEVIMFTVTNIMLFDEDATSMVIKIAEFWAMATWVKVLILEVVTLLHLALMTYMTVLAYEHYCMACDIPAMIEAEHARLAADDKSAAADRFRSRC